MIGRFWWAVIILAVMRLIWAVVPFLHHWSWRVALAGVITGSLIDWWHEQKAKARGPTRIT